MSRRLDLVCPAGTPASLRAAVDAGGDAVYLGFRDETNARNFPGLNFSRDELKEGIAYAHERGAKVFVAVNTYPRAGNLGPWRQAVDDAARLKADAVILADIGLADYAARTHPQLGRHLSVQASASNPAAIGFYRRELGVRRVVLPRVLTIEEIAALNAAIEVETEVFVFGGLCVMAEGRCTLSSYATPCSPNREGVCSPAAHVRYVEKGDATVTKLGDFTLNVVQGGERAAYPTTCKGRYRVAGAERYLFEEPASLSAMHMLPELAAAGVTALKIEGRQRGRAYVAQVVAAFRRAVDAVAAGAPLPAEELAAITEGGKQTTGAYRRSWQ
ncbi:ubiquinone anaerobic biosynthesis protein UbiU [Shumkonia mesophila]|uniref:ubiquinone anaerobic biosynthesis protein UbiU n=1 Tax=Shumkonia mesophila TaxID=2838854 RepID=UPI0029350BCD|nr:peptidase U32 family protein [Shumkonia mesophila]